MRLLLLCTALLATGANAADDDAVDEVSKVLRLTDATFDETVKDGFWLIEFFAPWCGHCKKLAPVLDETAKELGGVMKIAAIDATANKKLAKRYGVKGYPSIKFRVSEAMPVLPYKGKRDKEAFLEFAKRMTGPAVHKLGTKDAHDKFAPLSGEERVWFLHGKGGDADQRQDSDYLNAARQFQDSLLFAETSTKETLASYTQKGNFIARIENTVNAVEVGYFEDGEGSLEEWVRANRFPSLNKVGSNNFRELGHNTGKLFVIGCIDASKPEHGDFVDMMQTLALPKDSPVAAAVREQYVFGYLDGTKWEKFIAQFNIQQDQLPRLFVLDAVNSKFYEDAAVGPGAEVYAQFLVDVVDGKVPVQREGIWGLPTRIWNMLVKWWPWSVLFAIPPILLLYALVQMCRDDEYEDQALVERAEAEEKKKDK